MHRHWTTEGVNPKEFASKTKTKTHHNLRSPHKNQGPSTLTIHAVTDLLYCMRVWGRN